MRLTDYERKQRKIRNRKIVPVNSHYTRKEAAKDTIAAVIIGVAFMVAIYSFLTTLAGV